MGRCLVSDLKFDGLPAVLEHFQAKSKEIESLAAVYRSQLLDLTGHDPSKPVTALDVIKIVQRVFFAVAEKNEP